MSDELGDFFAEIKTIENVVASDSSANIISQEIVSKPQTISKPAEVYKSEQTLQTISSHPVYTYGHGEDEAKQTVVDNYPLYTSNTHSTATFPPSVALPTVPRQNKKFVRASADEVWVDDTLNEWPENDYRLFVGNLAKEVFTEHLARHFQNYKSFTKAKVIPPTHESKARYGFVSFLDPMDCAKALREQNGKYLCSRPMKIKKSEWKSRDIKEVKKKDNKKRKLQESLGLV